MTYIFTIKVFRSFSAFCMAVMLFMGTTALAGGGGGSSSSGGGNTNNTSFGGSSTSVRGSFTTDRSVAAGIASGANAMTSTANRNTYGSFGVRSTYSSTGGWGYSVGRAGIQSGGNNNGGNTSIRTTPRPGTPRTGTPGTPRTGTPVIPPLPPTLSFVAEVNDGTDYTAPATIRVSPNDKIDLTWNSSNATSCSGPLGSSSLDDTVTLNPNAIVPGSPRTFRVSCTGLGGSIDRTIIAEVPGLVINLTTDRELVRYGETVTYTWAITLSPPLSSGSTTPYPMNCVMSGGANRAFNAATEPTGTITSEALTNSRQTTLTCTEVAAGTGYTVTDSTVVEIIPRSEEI